MAKKNNFKFAGRALFNVVVAGLILSLVSGLLAGFGSFINLLISAGIIMVAIPMILKKRKGPETVTSLVLALPLGVILVGLVSAIGINLPTLALGQIGTVTFALAFASYFLADLLYLTLFKK